MANELQGRKITILLAPKGTEQAEFFCKIVEEFAEVKHEEQSKSA
jgi:hypothetical protein